MTRTLIIHIGLEKTGTTSFQEFCFDNRQALHRQGLLYPTHNLGFAGTNHAPIVAAYLARDVTDFNIARVPGTPAEVIASLRREIDSTPCPIALISAEHFSSRFTRDRIGELARDLSGFEVRIAVTIRDHRARFFSSYSTHVASGGELPLNQYAAHMQSGSRYFRVAETLTDWQEVFGKDKLDLFDYDAHPDIIPVVLTRYLPTGLPPSTSRRYRSKTAMSPAVTEALRRVNVALARKQDPAIHDSYAAFLRQRLFQGAIARQLARLAPHSPADRWQLSEAESRRLDVIAETDRAWLERQHGFVPQPRPPAADETAAESPSGPDPADLLALALVEASTQGRWRLGGAAVRAYSLTRDLAARFRR